MARKQYKCSKCRVLHFAASKIGRRHKGLVAKPKRKAKRKVAKRKAKRRVVRRATRRSRRR